LALVDYKSLEALVMEANIKASNLMTRTIGAIATLDQFTDFVAILLIFESKVSLFHPFPFVSPL